ncbi:hypothetical protein PSTG_18832, partial [Puccinia striiformis f. sp. tritici PST-78]
MSNQPSMDAIKWHERLGHANDKAVKKFLERFVSVEAARNWPPFDPLNLHRPIHSKVVALKRSGKNFVAWERQINETLDFVFHTDDFITNSSWDLLHTKHFPSVTILLRSSVELSMRNMLAK